MVDLPVPAADAPGQLRISGSETRPDFRPDAAAHAFMIEVIVVGSRSRRMDAAAEVALEVSIFAGIVGDFGEERLRQIVRVEVEPDRFEHIEPENLQFEIVVRLRDQPECGIERIIEKLLTALQRGADRPADALAEPAAVNFIEIGGIIHLPDGFFRRIVSVHC